MATSEVIWDSTPVPEKWIRTKEIPFTHSNGGTQLYLSHIQSHFLDLDFIIGRVCHESKSVPTSSQFNLQSVDSDALNGAIGKNPFDFKHYKINFVALNVDG
jgi:hypothetical protein